MIFDGSVSCADFGAHRGVASAENFSHFSAQLSLSVSVDSGRGGSAIGSMTEQTSMLRQSSLMISQHTPITVS
jgi:hypothetical protein